MKLDKNGKPIVDESQEDEALETSTEEDEEELDTELDDESGEEEEEQPSTNADEEPGDEDDDSVVLTFGDDESPEEEELDDKDAPEWVRNLRKTNREQLKRIRELEAQNAQKEKEKPATPQPVGAKPKLEDFDYDTEKFETALLNWNEQKRKADELKRQKQQEEAQIQEEWKKTLATYGEKKSQLKVRDFDEVEEVVLSALDQTQQGIMVQGAEDAAKLVYALGKNPTRLKELASIKDPVKFAFAAAKLEKDMKVRGRKAPPPPERPVSGTGPKSGTVDNTLEKLRKEAEKTGDYTKVHRYKRQKAAATT